MTHATVRAAVLGAFAALATLTACGGGGGGSVPLPASAPGHAAPANTSAATAPALAAVGYASSALAGAKYAGPAQFAGMGIDVIPSSYNSTGLEAYADSVSDPTSPSFRQYLTPQQIGDRFGADMPDYQAEAAYFRTYGLTVAGWPQRMMLHVGGTQAQLESAFGAKFGVYTTSGGAQMIAFSTPPKLPQALHVASIQHADIAPHEGWASLVPSLGPVSGLSFQQLAHTFDYDGAWAAGYTGNGITIGTLAWGTLNPNDVPAYGALFGAKVATVSTVVAQDSGVFPSPVPSSCATPTVSIDCSFSHGLSTPPPLTAPCNTNKVPLPTCNPEDGESQLDTQAIAALAYGAKVLFYVAYNPTECFASGNYSAPGATCPPSSALTTPEPELGAGNEFNPEVQQVISDDAVDVLNMSYQSCEQQDVGSQFDQNGRGFGADELAALAAEGIAVFASSGDYGTTACNSSTYSALPYQAVSWPASDRHAVGVGGVFAPVNQAGSLIGQVAAWGNSNDYGGACSDCSGSGGGVSQIFRLPANQFGPGLTPGLRNVPDISFVSAANSGTVIVTYAGSSTGTKYSTGNGTSQSAPMASAAWALVLQACKATPSCATASGPFPYRLGDPKGYLYSIYANQPYGGFSAKLGQTYGSTFLDVLYGNNSTKVSGAIINGYSAGPGYDNVTGLGVPYVRELIKAVVGV